MTKFTYTTAIDKMRRMKRRFRVVQGGTSAGKTFGILPLLIDYAAKNPLKTISVVSESIPHLRKGAMKDFITIMKLTNRWSEKAWSKGYLTYTFSNGSTIEFFSARDEEKVRGPRRDVLYMNEANNLRFDTFHQLSIRTNEFVYIDYNPSAEFWAHTELVNNPVEKEDVDFIIVTYKDNEALSKSIVKDIEKAKEKAKTSSFWANWWKVYGLGLIGSLEGVIFPNWSQIDYIPDSARLLGFGIDFGFTNDPTACVAVWKHNGKIIFDEVIYRTGMMSHDIAAMIKAYHPNAHRVPVFCDAAEPKTIASLVQLGIQARKASKGKDSIKKGIELLNQSPFLVTSSSLETIKELRAYLWAKSKEGKTLNVPIEYFNHIPDAMRYWGVMNIKPIGAKRRGIRRAN